MSNANISQWDLFAAHALTAMVQASHQSGGRTTPEDLAAAAARYADAMLALVEDRKGSE